MPHTTPEEREALKRYEYAGGGYFRQWGPKGQAMPIMHGGDFLALLRRLLRDLEDAEAAAKHHSLDRAAAEFQRDLALAERDRLRAEVEEDAATIERLSQFYADAGDALAANHMAALEALQRAEAERDKLRAEVERLTRSRLGEVFGE